MEKIAFFRKSLPPGPGAGGGIVVEMNRRMGYPPGNGVGDSQLTFPFSFGILYANKDVLHICAGHPRFFFYPRHRKGRVFG